MMGASASFPVQTRRIEVAPWVVVALGFCAMYLPSYLNAWRGPWQTDEHGHIPLILAIVVWLFWGARAAIHAAPYQPSVAWGAGTLALGLLLYAVGRGFGVSSIEFASQPLVVASVLLLLRGKAALRQAWFPVIFLVFMVPLPQSMVDAVTGPLKAWISVIVVELLHRIGYSIGHSGVVISVGPYQLLVADACSGLNSMFSLAALGTLYMHIVRRESLVHNLLMLASILPIAFAANIVRVIVLVLVTYHLGDEAGQGFLHGSAGMILIVVAQGLFFVLDASLGPVLKRVGLIGQLSR